MEQIWKKDSTIYNTDKIYNPSFEKLFSNDLKIKNKFKKSFIVKPILGKLCLLFKIWQCIRF
jgi:hypothetical protein